MVNLKFYNLSFAIIKELNISIEVEISVCLLKETCTKEKRNTKFTNFSHVLTSTRHWMVHCKHLLFLVLWKHISKYLLKCTSKGEKVMEELKSIHWVTIREWVLNYACEYASALLQKCQWPLRWSRHEALYNVNNMGHWNVFLPLGYSQQKWCLSKCRFRYLFRWQTLANLKKSS